jgi:hypothetical protein
VYYHKEKARLRLEIKADYEQHKKECLADPTKTKLIPVARQNQFLAKRLLQEPQSLQDQVEAMVMNKSTASGKTATAIDVLSSKTEEERVETAKKLQG